MRMLWLAAAIGAALVAGCQVQPQPSGLDGQQGWRAGPYYGPMMGYGYCPGAANADGGGQQGWYGSGMMGGRRHGGMMGGGMMAGPMMGGGGAFNPEQAAAWLDAAKAEIGITAEQEQAWSAYADAVQADRESMLAMHAQMPTLMGGGGGANAPDRLQAHLGLMQARIASLQDVQASTQALFQVLTPEQRERANRTLWSGCW